MEKNTEFVQVEVVSNNTERTVLSFQTKAESAITNGYKRIAAALGVDRTIASMHYHVNIVR